jgi:uncharacterized protein
MSLNPQKPSMPENSFTPPPPPDVAGKLPPELDVAPATIVIQVSPDALKASVGIMPPDRLGGGDLTMEFILQKWKDMGLDPEAFDYDGARALAQDWNRLRQPIEGRLMGEAVHLPQPGLPGRVEYIVDPNLKIKPSDQAGNVDFKNLSLIKPVKKGQIICRRMPAGKGAPGIDLFGRPAPAPDGAEVEMPQGTNVEVSGKDGDLLVASVDGFLQQKEGKIHVNECFIVDGSVDYSTGNITYDQSAIIRGDVQDG